MGLALTLERRRGGEAVLRDGRGRRFVLPVELVPRDAVTLEVGAAPIEPDRAGPELGRGFLTALLTRA